MAFAEFDVRRGMAEISCHERRVAPGQCQHLIRHIHADDAAGRTDAPGRIKAINASARSDVQHCLAGLHGRQPRGRAAAIRCMQHFLGNECLQVLEVVPRRTTHLLAGGYRPGIAFAHLLSDGFIGHSHLSALSLSRTGGLCQS